MDTSNKKEVYEKYYQSALDNKQEFEIIFNVYYGSNSADICEKALKTRNFLAEKIGKISAERIGNKNEEGFFFDLFNQLQNVKNDFDPEKKLLASAAIIFVTRCEEALKGTYPAFFLFD